MILISECGIQMCAIECPSGFKQDDRGCDMCECNPEDNSGMVNKRLCLLSLIFVFLFLTLTIIK